MATLTIDKLGLPTNPLNNRTAVITGGASGIGEATCKALAHLGATVLIMDIKERGNEVAAFISPGGISELSMEDWENAFHTNILGSVRLIKSFLPQMLEQDGGAIANLVSVDAMPFASHYAASKSAIKSLILSLSDELGKKSPVSIFGYVPGMVDTPAVQETMPKYASYFGLTLEDFVSRLPNPGYRGLMPAEDSAAALAYFIVKAKELHGQFVDPYHVLAKAGIIELPEAKDQEVKIKSEEYDLEKITTEFKKTVEEVTTLNKNLEHRIEVRTRELHEERDKSEKLLLNILPKPIADRLKEKEAIIADSFPNVSVLFADICNFTGHSNEISAETLVASLNKIFFEFDALASKYHIEKIKTIGDCYMAVGGLVERREDHLENLCHFAIEIRKVIQKFELGSSPLQMRIGIHSGPVVAGVIGQSKFTYDLWGETVNFASRLESYGVPGMIQVSEEVHASIKHKFTWKKGAWLTSRE